MLVGVKKGLQTLTKKKGNKNASKPKNIYTNVSISKLAFRCFFWIRKIPLYAQVMAKKLQVGPKWPWRGESKDDYVMLMSKNCGKNWWSISHHSKNRCHMAKRLTWQGPCGKVPCGTPTMCNTVTGVDATKNSMCHWQSMLSRLKE